MDSDPPLYRDPIFDGPTDPVLVWNCERRQWWMFYTQRRATAPANGVALRVRWSPGYLLALWMAGSGCAAWAVSRRCADGATGPVPMPGVRCSR